MKNIAKIVFLVVILTSSASAGSIVRIEPAFVSASTGQEFTINVTIDPSENPNTAAQFDLRFDPYGVEIVDPWLGPHQVTEGDMFKQNGANTVFNPGILDNSAGTLISVWGLIIVPNTNVTTKGTLATITLKSKSEKVSQLFLSNVIVSDPQSEAVPLTIYGSWVNLDPDVNQDGVVDIFDAKKVKNVLDGDPTPCPRCRVLGNNNVTVFDIVAVIENVD